MPNFLILGLGTLNSVSPNVQRWVPNLGYGGIYEFRGNVLEELQLQHAVFIILGPGELRIEQLYGPKNYW